MVGGADQVDRNSFAQRREVRDLLRPFLVEGGWKPEAFERALEQLARQRELALRQIVRFYQEGRIADEMAALEVLGRLATPEDDAFLSRIAADTEAPESARVACALVLLGHDALDRIGSRDVSKLVLRWQARFLAEEPSLRPPLMRLYAGAPTEERAAWAALQERELADAEGRAAVFEMLLEVEDDPKLRHFLIDALARLPGPAPRAALRRVEGTTPEERDRITGALARMAAEADAAQVPEGWSSRVGFCDGTGSFPLRFDLRAPGRRPRSVIFVLNLETGVRETLPLTGLEVERYDRLVPEGEEAGSDDEGTTAMVPLSVPQALGLLVTAERLDEREQNLPPMDYHDARRLLDPLADLRPITPEPPGSDRSDEAAQRSGRLLDHAGYAGWFYDAGDHLLDEVRLDVLRTCRPGKSPGDALVTRAAQRLARSGEPRRLVRMLRHNALVHEAAGERELAEAAEAAAGAIADGHFADLPLVRRMVRESLHPGHYFLTPIPDVPERHDLASLLLDTDRPTKSRLLLVDLAWILTRAMEVWLSRVPCRERPHSDHVQAAVFTVAKTGARRIGRFMGDALGPSGPGLPGEGFGDFAGELREAYRASLDACAFPKPDWDPGQRFLLDLLVQASESLVFRICLGSCPARCLLEPRRSGAKFLRPGRFPAGRDAEVYVRTWPGVFLHQPTPSQEHRLAAFVAGTLPRPADPPEDEGGEAALHFVCSVCGDERAVTARARSRLVAHGENRGQAVCRRCQRRYRRDADFRAEIVARLGRLVY
jgi:hypothetical protein